MNELAYCSEKLHHPCANCIRHHQYFRAARECENCILHNREDIFNEINNLRDDRISLRAEVERLKSLITDTAKLFIKRDKNGLEIYKTEFAPEEIDGIVMGLRKAAQ